MAEDPTYQVGSWNDLPQYVCLRCGYDAFSLTQLEVHITMIHDGHMLAAPPGWLPPDVPDEGLMDDTSVSTPEERVEP